MSARVRVRRREVDRESEKLKQEAMERGRAKDQELSVPVYAVRGGKKPGVYDSLAEAKAAARKGGEWKWFDTREEAVGFSRQRRTTPPLPTGKQARVISAGVSYDA